MIEGVFPCPVYIIKRDLNLSPTQSLRLQQEEEIEIENIIEEGLLFNMGSNSNSISSYIFNTGLKKIKQFCEEQIKIYVEQIICPVEEDLDFYITQSWLNVNRPGESHYEHCHSNSIISGVFYISTEEDDSITFIDPNYAVKDRILFKTKSSNIWNSEQWSFQSNINELILFPSWLNHMVNPNPKATKDRLSISFNTFVRGTLGEITSKNKLILK
tara:strand:+ start:1157 stop:1801 length:645 start_codon:yes stop_codon:yes gene_type:complete